MEVVAVKSVNVERSLPCQLSYTEKIDFGKKLADLEHAKRTIEREKEGAVKAFKEQITATEFGIGEVTGILRAGEERRLVRCRWGYDWGSMMKTLTREDTGEIVETAIIQPEERQMNIGEMSAG